MAILRPSAAATSTQNPMYLQAAQNAYHNRGLRLEHSETDKTRNLTKCYNALAQAKNAAPITDAPPALLAAFNQYAEMQKGAGSSGNITQPPPAAAVQKGCGCAIM